MAGSGAVAAHESELSCAPDCRAEESAPSIRLVPKASSTPTAHTYGVVARWCINLATPSRSRETAHRTGGVNSVPAARPTGRTAEFRTICRAALLRGCTGGRAASRRRGRDHRDRVPASVGCVRRQPLFPLGCPGDRHVVGQGRVTAQAYATRATARVALRVRRRVMRSARSGY
jgi:hypothetical protein